VIKGLSRLEMERGANVGRLNWITANQIGHPQFSHEPRRTPSLRIGKWSGMTHRHIVDCSGGLQIGDFSLLAGFRSQILTHSVDVTTGMQSSKSVEIGDRVFIGTQSVLLPGARIPNRSVVGAGSVLPGPLVGELGLFAGVPARRIKSLPADLAFFAWDGLPKVEI
jgi:hypothetical protein